MNRLSKSALIGLGAVVLTTVGIGASDIANNVRSNLTGMVIDSSVSGPCAPGSVLVQLGESTICADILRQVRASNVRCQILPMRLIPGVILILLPA